MGKRHCTFCVFVCLILVVLSNGSKFPVHKTIKTEDGDVYECIDVHKQPSLQHPALKEHKVQMMPSSILARQNDNRNTVIGLKEGCPLGSVPILKPTRKLTSQNMTKPLQDATRGIFFAGVTTKEGQQVTGAEAYYSIYNPKLTATGQRSSAILALESRSGGSYSRIEAGWTVNPELYGDDRTRLYTYWTRDESRSTGCFDTTCPGFIHTSTNLPLGYAFRNISVPRERYFDLAVLITKGLDGFYLHVGNPYDVGYWPFDIVPNMKDGPLKVKWGGQVFMPDTRTLFPQMGDGKYKFKRYFQSNAYVKKVAMYDQDGAYVVPGDDTLQLYLCPCYLVGRNEYREDPNLQYSFVYGGSGGVYGKDCVK